jgi:hypothetical protein
VWLFLLQKEKSLSPRKGDGFQLQDKWKLLRLSVSLEREDVFGYRTWRKDGAGEASKMGSLRVSKNWHSILSWALDWQLAVWRVLHVVLAQSQGAVKQLFVISLYCLYLFVSLRQAQNGVKHPWPFYLSLSKYWNYRCKLQHPAFYFICVCVSVCVRRIKQYLQQDG